MINNNTDLLTKDDVLPIGKLRKTTIAILLTTNEGKKQLRKTIDTFQLNVSDEIKNELQDVYRKESNIQD